MVYAGEKTGGNYKFDRTVDPELIFENFFGTRNPFQALNDIALSLEEMTTDPQPKPGKAKLGDVEATMEEVYHGCLKKFLHNKKILDEEGRISEDKVELCADIKPGTLEGTKYVFEGVGNILPLHEPGHAIYALKTLPHPRFKRGSGYDLIYSASIPAVKSLTGGVFPIHHLDGRVLHLPLTEIKRPGDKVKVPNEGMPNKEGGKGDLIVEFDVVFPKYLSDTQKTIIAAGFLCPQDDKLNKEQRDAIHKFTVAFKDDHKGWNRAPSNEKA